MNLSDGGIATKIDQLEKEIISLRQKAESTRQAKISSRVSFYESQANTMGKIAAIVFKLELVHCRSTPFNFTRDTLLLDFYSYSIEKGLDKALEHAMRLEHECS